MATSNKGTVRGGAIHTSSTNFIYENTSFINNSIGTIISTAQGGAIYSSGGRSSTCINCQFYNNYIDSNSNKFSGDVSFNIQGGSFCLESSTVDFIDCTFQNNSCFGNGSNWDFNLYGGAIYAINSKLKINNCYILNNRLFSYGEESGPPFIIEGGAICIINTDFNMTGCEINDNSILMESERESAIFMVNFYGGSLYSSNKGELMKLNNCSFSSNSISHHIN